MSKNRSIYSEILGICFAKSEPLEFGTIIIIFNHHYYILYLVQNQNLLNGTLEKSYSACF